MIPLVLASASPSRRQLLRQAGVEPLVCPADIDEDAVLAGLPPGTPPAEAVRVLAAAKVDAVWQLEGPRLSEWARTAGAERMALLGCDSMLLVDGRLEGKPHTVEVARRRWHEVAGRAAELLTGHALVVVDPCAQEVRARAADTGRTVVHFGRPTDAELDAYLATGEPLEVAGAFTLEALGGWFVDRLEGDPSSVVGLGLPLLRRLLHTTGIQAHDLWTDSPTWGPSHPGAPRNRT